MKKTVKLLCLGLLISLFHGSLLFARTADHSSFEALKGPFKSGPEVTKACLSCHNLAAHQVMDSLHWKLDTVSPTTGKRLGKMHAVNNFCGSPISNEPRCTSCHIGYGWKDKHFDASKEENVDCLACHDTTGTYKKVATDAGHPLYEPREIPPGSGKIVQPPDLTKIAKHVGKPGRENCGSCHFYGGGGDAVKHGDLDSSMGKPKKVLDVHMGTDGQNMVCADCHTFNNHQPSGSRYTTRATDPHGIDLPKDDHDRATCQSCHGQVPHKKAKLNDHTDRVACQTCHIPEFARGGIATKTWWDWSTAGKRGPDGKPLFIKDEKGRLTYSAEKGDFEYGENVRPTYKWYNGIVRHMNFDDKIDDSKVLEVNPVEGAANDPKARIWPFKVMRGKQPYDTVNKTLIVNHVFGNDDTSLWSNFDYTKSIPAGMSYAGLPYSGKFGFIETEMNWFITHMVAPKENAVPCGDCHTKSPEGRLAGLKDFYLPGRDVPGHKAISWLDMGWLDIFGFAGIALTILGCIGHAFVRLFTRRYRSQP